MYNPDILFDKKETLKVALNNKAFVVDVRTPIEFIGGSFTNAINIPLDEIPNRLNEFMDKGEIIVFCRSGHRSQQAKEYLLGNGFSNVLNGGNKTVMEEVSKL